MFTVKNKVGGSIERYIAGPAAKGFTQTLGLDHHETFALVAKLNSISSSILGRKQILAAFLARCQKCFPRWRYSRKRLDVYSSRFCNLGGNRDGLQVTKGTTQVKTIPSRMIQKI